MTLHLSIAVLVLAAGAASAQNSLPTFPAGTTSDTFFGTPVADPFRGLEDTKDRTVAAWMKAHSDHAHRSLQALPQRAALLASIQKYDDAATARVGEVRRTADQLFFLKRAATDNQFKLYRRDAQGRDTLLVDPGTFDRQAGGTPHAINWFAPSADGRRLAYGVSAAGSESATLHVLDVATGRPLGRPIPRADFGGAVWTDDARRLYFVQLQALKPGASPLDKYRNSRVMGVTPGSRALPRAVLGPGTPGVRIAPEEIPFVDLSADGRYAFAFVVNGVQREQRMYAADQRAFLAGRPQWKRLFDRDAQIVGSAYAQGTLYAVTYRGAPRYRLIAAAVDGFDPAKATTVLAPSERVLTGVAAASDALYIEQRDGNVKRLSKLPLVRDGQLPAAPVAPTPIALPVDGAFTLFSGENGTSAADPRLPGLLIDLQSWTRARQFYQVAADGSVRNTGLQPAGPYDAPEHIVATELQCKSHDGALVPMSVVHKKGLVLDGKQPTLLYGYASYGITEEPFFSTGRLAWIDAGGVFAIANPRGSSVYGEDWYKAGFQASKPNTWKDFIACAETLIAAKYTEPARLGILGGSAGGILVGRAMTERPDLFAAVVPAVGALDMVRAEVTPNGVPNIPEFGTRATEAGFRALLAMSTYHQIQDGTKYPAVLLTHGVNDPRVEVWHSTKTAARLLAASKSGKPVLLRLDYDAGHGVGSTKAQQHAERADIYAFLLAQMGGAPAAK